MAKKEKFDLDDFGIDSSLGVGDMDFDFGSVGNNRKPITNFAYGAVRGAKDTVLSESFLKRTMKGMLPPGYSEAMDLSDKTTGSLKNLYNDGAKELKPAMNDLKRITNRLLPTTKDYTPKGVNELLSNWAKDEGTPEQREAMTAQEQQEAQIAMSADIFKYNAATSERHRAEDEVKDRVNQAIGQHRHVDQLHQLQAIHRNTARMAAYNDKVNIGFQRKSLELQHRHYFVAVESLKEQKLHIATLNKQMESILHNTSLTEAEKSMDEKRAGGTLRNKYLSGLGGNLWSKRSGFVDNVAGNLKTALISKIADLANTISTGVMIGESVLDVREMEKSMGISKAESAGDKLAAFYVEKYGKEAAEWIKKNIVGKNKTLQKHGNTLSRVTKNLPQMANAWASKGDTGFQSGIGGFLTSLLKESILGATGIDKSLQTDHVSNLNQPQQFSRRDSKALSEVIPGFLARLLQSSEGIRTGKPGPLTEYDYRSNKFVPSANKRAGIYSSLFSDDQREMTKYQTDGLIDELEKGSGTKLTKEQRAALAKQMVTDNVSMRSGDKRRMTDIESYHGDAGRHAGKFASMFDSYYADDEVGEKELKFTNDFNNLGSSISDIRSQIQQIINTGDIDALVEMGVVNDNGGGEATINMDRVYELFVEGGYKPKDLVRKASRKRGDARNGPVKHRAAGGRVEGGGLYEVNENGPELIEVDGKTMLMMGKSSGRVVANQRGNRRAKMNQHLFGGEAIPMGGSGGGGMSTYGGRGGGGGYGGGTGGGWTGSSNDPFDMLIAAIRESSAREAVEDLHDSVMNIEELIQSGAVGGGGGGMFSGMKKGMFGRAVRKGKDLFGRAKKGFMAGLDARRRLITKVGATAKRWAGNAIDWAFDNVPKFYDVYIRGEVYPRLMKAKLEAGKYYDKVSGKVIKKWKDIKGAVIDEDGNFVMSAEELKTAFFNSRVGKTMLLGYTSAKSLLGKLGEGLMGLATARMPQRLRDAIETGKDLLGSFNGVVDVYVAGKKEPVLLARDMRNGDYFSVKTGNTIKNVRDIKGAVFKYKDGKAEVVLTEAEFKDGLKDADGNPLRSGPLAGLQRLGDKLKGVLGGAKNFLLGGIQGAGNWISGLFKKDGIVVFGNKTIVERLTEIRDLLTERLPSKKHVVGDIDGDGVREGSYKDLVKGDKEKAADTATAEDRKAAAEERKGGKGFFGSMAGGLASLFGKKKKKEGEEGEDGEKSDKGGGWMSTAAEAASTYFATRLGMKGGLGPAAKAGGKFLGKWGGRIAAPLAVGYGAKSAYDLATGQSTNKLSDGIGVASGVVGAGTLVGMATGTGTLGGLATIAGGVGTAGGAIASGVGTLGAAAAGLITWPVVLVAAAVAAVGTAGYFGYKWLTSDSLTPLSTVRYAQYGFGPADKDHLQQIFKLEKMLKEVTGWRKGVAYVDDSKVKSADVLKIFGVDEKDQKAVSNFATWYDKRFKPVYLVNMSAMRLSDEKATLSEIKSMTKSAKKKFLDMIKWPDGPYDVMVSPFPDLKELKVTGEGVGNAVKLAEAAIAKMKDDPASDEKKEAESGGVIPEAAAGELPADKKALMIGATAAVAAANAPSANDAAGQGNQSAGSKALGSAAAAAAGAAVGSGAAMTTIASNSVVIDKSFNGKLDALTAIRYKAYGLTEMDYSKMRSLDMVESVTQADITYDSQGRATWSGSIDKIFAIVCSDFGCSPDNSYQKAAFTEWFQYRFMPVYLALATSVKAATKKDNVERGVQALDATQSVSVAGAIIGAKADITGVPAPVWRITTSPWPGYEMNGDVGSTEGNLAGLREDSKSVVAEETTAGGQSTKTKKLDGEDAKNAGPQKTTGFFGRLLGAVGLGGDNNQKSGGGGGNWFTNMFKGNTAADVRSGKTSGDPGAGFSGGAAITQPGNGTGGDINALPMPQGDGTYQAMKPLLDAVAKMVGVDPALLASICTIESGFKSTASSGIATGLFQFTKGTWKEVMAKYAKKYGIDPNTPPTDARANALLGAEFIKGNIDGLKSIGRPVTDNDVYMAHFLGLGGARKFLSADPALVAANVFPAEARSNPDVFYDKNRTPLTIGQIYSNFGTKLNNAKRKYGLAAGDTNTTLTGGKSSGSEAIVNKPADGSAGSSAAPASSTSTATKSSPDVSPDGSNRVSIPVANTAPAAQAGANNSNPAAAAMGSGFTGPQAAAQTQSSVTQRSMSDQLLSDMSDIHKQQLAVQQAMDDKLNKILGIMTAKASGSSGDTASAAATSTATGATQQRRDLSAPPIPMRRAQ